MGMLISENYRALNKDLHASKPHYGTSGSKRASDVERFAQKLNAQSILDYGCGKQTLGKALPHLPIIAYDPAIPELANPPMPADFVVCTDVLEHIEPEFLENVLDDLKRLAIKGIFVVVSTCAAKKFLGDGRNAHLIQQSSGWWLPKLMVRWDINQFQVAENEFSMFGLASRETVVQDVSQGDVSKKSDIKRAEHLNAEINELTAWLLNSKNTTKQSVNLKKLELDEINQRLIKLETKLTSTKPKKKSYKTKKVVSS